jgi:hypothetical protein
VSKSDNEKRIVRCPPHPTPSHRPIWHPSSPRPTLAVVGCVDRGEHAPVASFPGTAETIGTRRAAYSHPGEVSGASAGLWAAIATTPD